MYRITKHGKEMGKIKQRRTRRDKEKDKAAERGGGGGEDSKAMEQGTRKK